MSHNLWLIMTAGGTGARFGHELPKQYLLVNNKTVIEHSMEAFRDCDNLQGIVITHPKNDPYLGRLSFDMPMPIWKVVGGETRFQSVANALIKIREMANAQDWILVHDAVRPCLHPQDLAKLISYLHDDEVGGILASRLQDTLKRTDTAGKIIETVDRTHCWQALTPQMFRFEILDKAITHILEKNISVTDDAQAVQLLGYTPCVVEADHPNPKLTFAQDLSFIEHILWQLSQSIKRSKAICIV